MCNNMILCKGDLVYIDLKSDIESVQSGLRPCVIVQNDTGNKFSPTTIIVPITSKKKNNLPTHVKIKLKVESTILCEQIQTINKKMIKSKFGKITGVGMEKVNKALKVSLGM